MRSFWEESPEDKVERLTEEVETLRFEQERHAEELKEQMESQFHQQQYEARIRADTEREERQREESDRQHRAHRERLSTSHHSLVKRILEAAVCAKRGTELSSEDVGEKAMENFLNFIAKLMADKVYLIAEFPEYVKTMSADDYAEYKIRPPEVEPDDEDDDDGDPEPYDPIRDVEEAVERARRNLFRGRVGHYESLDGRRIEEAKRVIDFAVALPELHAALRKMGAASELQKKAGKLASIMDEISSTLREHAEAALAKATEEAKRDREEYKRNRAEGEALLQRTTALRELEKSTANVGPWVGVGIGVPVLASFYFTSGWPSFILQLLAAGGVGLGALLVPGLPFLFLAEWVHDNFVKVAPCDICGRNRTIEKLSSCNGCKKVLCTGEHADCCAKPSHSSVKW